LAKSTVQAGAAEIHNANGRARRIRLFETVSSHLQRIGEPSDGHAKGVRFARIVQSDAGVTWIAHHPRCWDYK
jgi:hypothetical protein